MRFRLTTKPPLPPLKAWYAVSPTPGYDITNLKSELLSRLQALQAQGLSHRQILLSVDDFELLDDSGLDVIKENDIVCISIGPSASSASRKRRADSSNLAPRKRRKSAHPSSARRTLKQHEAHPTSSSSSETQSSSSSETSSSASSSLEAESSEETSSSSESTSSSGVTSNSDADSAIEIHLSNIPTNDVPARTRHERSQTTAPAPVVTVPPGHGKASTRSRNVRRRLKRLYEKQRTEAERLASKSLPSDSPNAIPLGNNLLPKSALQPSASSSVVTMSQLRAEEHAPSSELSSTFNHVTVEAEQITSTLKNKNKKKGFKRDMVGITPQRIVFSTEDASVSGLSRPSLSRHNSFQDHIVPSKRLITPSEKQARGLLPPNMFVTSVEVEGDRWDRKKKKKRRDNYGYDGDADFYAAEDADDRHIAHDETNDLILDYGEEGDAHSAKDQGSSVELDWSAIDAKWDDFETVDDILSLSPGSLIGWTELAINPTTFTPEMLVRVARVKELDNVRSVVILVIMRRPGEDEIAFGGAGILMEGGAEGDGGPEPDRVDEIQEVVFEDAKKAQWKLVRA